MKLHVQDRRGTRRGRAAAGRQGQQAGDDGSARAARGPELAGRSSGRDGPAAAWRGIRRQRGAIHQRQQSRPSCPISANAPAGSIRMKIRTHVASNLRGQFRLANVVLTLREARLRHSGRRRAASAAATGLSNEALEFDGTVRMKATVSQAAGGGMKSVLLKVVDPLFKSDGAGAVLPITDPRHAERAEVRTRFRPGAEARVTARCPVTS